MNNAFLNQLFNAHRQCPDCPAPARITAFFEELLGTLFPDFSKKSFGSPEELGIHMNELKLHLGQMLMENPQEGSVNSETAAEKFFNTLPEIHRKLTTDAKAMYEGDPAARSENEVMHTYPGFYAIAAYRIAHELHKLNIQVVPRMITEIAHSKTGIDIHPGAVIGENFCIDHGTGIVIGETTVIGNYVKIYQGVTLGALSVSKEDATKKRHPTIEDKVIIYAGATILGGKTVIGSNSVIGGNVWITQTIPPHTKMYYQARMHNHNTGETDLVVFKTKI